MMAALGEDDDGATVLLHDEADAAVVRAAAAAATRAGAAPDRVGAALAAAPGLAASLPLPASGATGTLWSALASIAAIDLGVARAVEPHLDAVAILAAAIGGAAGGAATAATTSATGSALRAATPDRATWGVYAAEGAGHRLVAREHGGAWELDGSKPWCSLATRVDRALVTASVGEERRLFAIDLRDPGVRVDDASAWASHGLADVPSVPIRLDRVRAEPVGEAGWYLARDGFAWGGIGVAAIWLGGAIGIARTMRDAARRREPDQLALALLGRVDRGLAASMATLARAASAVDAGPVADPAALALRVRGVVAATVDDVVRCADHAMGPAPLALDARHARRVDDLRVYVRQHHAERDDAALGRAVLDGAAAW